MTRHQYCLGEPLEKVLYTSSLVIYFATLVVVALPSGPFFTLSTNPLPPHSLLNIYRNLASLSDFVPVANAWESFLFVRSSVYDLLVFMLLKDRTLRKGEKCN